MQVEFEAKVFLPTHISIENVINGKELPYICEDGHGLYYTSQGYANIGTARVIITVDPKDKILANQIAALKAQLQTVRAENQQRENQLIDKISKLQAIAWSGEAA